MADSKRYVSNQPLYLEQILQEAQHRWLRPIEICEILRNYKKFQLTPDPPVKPSAGSLFLFDRKVLRYFRKDGHCWRKKKDGKTVKEAHEKLKAGSVDVLHCYYAHGEDNENFQRRSYWMLDEQLENIVLVHYREVKEGYKLGVHRLKNADSEPQLQSPQTDLSPCLEQTHSLETTTQTSSVYPNSVDWNGQTLSSEFEDGDSGEVPGFSSLVQLLQHTPHDPSFYADEISDAKLDADNIAQDVASVGDWLAPDYRTGQLENYSGVLAKVGFKAKVESSAQLGGATEVEAVELKTLDSFGRWMNKEIGGDFDDSLMVSDSGKYWNTLDTENEHKEASSLSLHMQLDTDSLGPSLSQQQLFSINDFTPDWTNSGVETKVLIVGSFLGDTRHFDGYKWCCMFGEIEVSAEVLSENVIRCQTPSHAPGRVPFYITCSNRLACSEVREFEFRQSSSRVPYSTAVKSVPEDELRNLIRLVKLLSSGLEKKQLYCTVEECDKCKVKNAIYALKNENKSNWGRVDEVLMVSEGRDELIQDLLKDKLYEWLACQTHEVDKGMNILDEEGQGVIHLVAALGFEWAVGPIVAAGVSPNFRDVRGKTALHWASYYGREETVIVLVRLGAAAGVVDDPTPTFPGGQKAADLASSRGHKGIAGYLAEADLTSHLSSLSVKGSVMDSAAVEILAEKDTENAAASVDRSHMLSDEDLSLKGSLAALRRSAHAAALIQDAFRVQSFRHRQTTKSSDDISEAPLGLVSLGCLSKVQQTNNFDGYLHSTAVKIQHKYRGWKGRKKFLKIRKRIVKIQAHECQVRKQYKRVVWSVSIVEKAILRWRRKKPGLRGFRMKTATESLGPDIEKNDEYDFLRIGRKQKFTGVDEALERVQSMMRHPEARDQYTRLVTKFEELKVREHGSCATQQVNSPEESEVDKRHT